MGRMEGARGRRQREVGDAPDRWGPRVGERERGEVEWADGCGWAGKEDGPRGGERRGGGRVGHVGRIGKGKDLGFGFFLFFQILFKQLFKPLFKSNHLHFFHNLFHKLF
jgi:hypothetical protein